MAALDRPGDAPDGLPGATTRSRRARAIITDLRPDASVDGNGDERPMTRAQRLQDEARARAELAGRHGELADEPLGDDDLLPNDFGVADDPDPVGAEGSVAVDATDATTADGRAAQGTGDADGGPPTAALEQVVAAVPFVDDAPATDPTPTPTGVPVPVVVVSAEVGPAAPIPDGRPAKQRTVAVRRQRPRVRRVRRVIRSIDAWTVFKVSLIFYAVLMVILLVAGVLLWNLAYATGTIDNLERFFESFGWETFRFHGGQIFHSAWIAGLFLIAGGTGLNVVMATVFNLIADLVGGVGVTVLEEEVRVVPDVQVASRRGASGQEPG